MTCISKEVSDENVRYVFIRDKNAPKFGLNVSIYVNQLDKGLMANVLDKGVWGSFRHLLLDRQNMPCAKSEHAYVNTLVKGDLTSLRWIGAQKPDKPFCSVYYASLNFR